MGTACSLSPVGVLYVHLLLLCVAVSLYTRKGASATAAVRLILYFDRGPPRAFYGPEASWLNLSQHAISACSCFWKGYSSAHWIWLTSNVGLHVGVAWG